MISSHSFEGNIRKPVFPRRLRLSQFLRGAACAGLAFGLVSGVAVAADLNITGNTAYTVPAGGLDLDCGNVFIEAGSTLNAGTGTLSLGGNWNNQGAFNRGTSTVAFGDQDCAAGAVSTISGATQFHILSGQTANGHGLTFESGQTQSVMNSLILTGTSAVSRLMIRSTIPGDQAFLNLDAGGNQTIDWVDVQDNNAPEPGQHLAQGTADSFNSIDSGNNFRWFQNNLPILNVPTLSEISLVMLALWLAVAAFSQRRAFRQTRPR